MGNWITNTSDLAYLQLDYVSDLTMSCSKADIDNIANSIEVLLDVPQFNSYDTHSETQTHHICSLERDTSLAQTVPFDDNAEDSSTWQTWSMKHKPGPVVVRPEVFQHKTWHVRLAFVGDSRPQTITETLPEFEYIQDYMLVFSVSK